MAGQIYFSIYKISEVSVSERLLSAISYSFLIYLLCNVFVSWEPLAYAISTEEKIQFVFSTKLSVIVLTLILTVFMPLSIGFIYFSDKFHGLLRLFNITTKTSRGNTWNDAFATQDRRVIVTLKDETRVRGYPTMFSTDPEEGYLYLFDPVWVNDNKEDKNDPDYLETNCHGFLVNRDNIDLIEFTLDEGEELTEKNKEHK